MPVTLTWSEIAVRLLCTLLAGSLLGLNRSKQGHAAGLRTSILVSLAACVAMLQVNLLLPLAGRPPDSFVMNDLMRLPLGILSGMGFIGAVAIVRRHNLIAGVTTAATMWYLTVLGLCFGGGQVAIGLVGTALGVIVLSSLKLVENKLKQDHQGKLVVVSSPGGPDEDEIRATVHNENFVIASSAFSTPEGAENREWSFEICWRAMAADTKIPPFVRRLIARQGVIRISWKAEAR
jgi:putative Mg2+ transporter-C (MgtC) family protein